MRSIPSTSSNVAVCSEGLGEWSEEDMVASKLGVSSISITGPLQVLNTMANALTYTAPSSYIGTASIDFRLNDNGNVGVGGELETHVQVEFEITRSDSIKILHATEVKLDEHVKLKASELFTRIDVEDSTLSNDAYELIFSIKPNDVLSSLTSKVRFECNAKNSSLLSVVEGDGKLVLRGSLSALNTAAHSETLVYFPDYFHGALEIQIFVKKEATSQYTAMATTRVVVSPLNDAPYLNIIATDVLEDVQLVSSA